VLLAGVTVVDGLLAGVAAGGRVATGTDLGGVTGTWLTVVEVVEVVLVVGMVVVAPVPSG
jgi:hypothetical protein